MDFFRGVCSFQQVGGPAHIFLLVCGEDYGFVPLKHPCTSFTR